MLFYKPTTSLIGPLAPVTIPRVAQPPKENLSDYEVEFTIVIGKPARDVSEADALDYVLAYTGANDVGVLSRRKHISHSFIFLDFIPQAPARRIAVGLLQELRCVFIILPQP